MSYAVGVVTFVVALLLSVMLHEAGHFATAKAFGMKASRFFVGFGPTLWSFRRGETEYGVKAIPAGGFVKIEGMTSLEEMPEGEESRAFWRQPAGQRVVVLVAGSVVHFIIAIVALFCILAATGKDQVRTNLRVNSIPACVKAKADAACTDHDPKAPAAGVLHKGDLLLAINGHKVSGENDDFRNIVAENAGRPVSIQIQRDGQPVTVSLKPVRIIVDGKPTGRVGITNELVPQHVSVAGAIPRTFSTLGNFTTSTVSAIGGLPKEIGDIVSGKPRDPEGAASVVDVARVSGQIAQAHVSVGDRIASLMLIIAELNWFVGIFNLLPLLPLDGGHVGILLFEQIRSRAYRMFGRRDPGRVDIMKVLPLTYAVVAVFVGLSVILLYAGIANPIRIQ